MVKISVVIPVYNGDKTIEKALRSVIKQNYIQKELIVIDGNSSDKTPQIIKKYEKYIDRVIREEDNGVYDAMNKGIKNSNGEYIYFLGADDYLVDREVLKKASKKIEELNQDLLYGKVLVRRDKNKKIKILGEPLSLKKIKRGYSPYHQATFTRRDLFNKIGGFNTRYPINADTKFFFRAFSSGSSYKYISLDVAVFSPEGMSSINFNPYEKYSLIKKYFGMSNAFFFILSKICSLLLDPSRLISKICQNFTKFIQNYPNKK